ncbi:phage late control D family protein [Pseudomonas sp. ANT_H12B]|uniref:phage late control D family protein n=1 Tax=Pseudomonas sp. ANT_H12B TaxID=2597348 RepID=UPI0011EFEE65|nr:late control protein D [Pseudomonas sp. ANT_H12B]KAA0972784.1 late control protein D [Pseudomonas sp. ANT_H12B]
MDAIIPAQVPQARFVLTYQQHNITRNVSQHLLSVSYDDYLTGQADSLAVELEDTEGKWRDQWYPGHGDSLTLSMGWEGQPLRALGRFEIDEVELNGPPSTITIHGLATGIKAALRTPSHHAYENTTLQAIAQQIAARQGLELIGTIQPIPLDRLTQQDADLTFLRNLAAEYDYAFKITGHRMVFHAISTLAKAAPVATLVLQDLSNVNLRDQIKNVPQAVEVKHKDPATKTLVAYKIENNQTVAVPSSMSKTTTSGDTQKNRKRSASTEESKAKAQAQLARANRERTTGSWSAMGRPNLVSGNVVTLVAAGKLGGRYLITTSQHRMTRSGYTVSQSVRRVSAH